jgi:hypothetical protein
MSLRIKFYMEYKCRTKCRDLPETIERHRYYRYLSSSADRFKSCSSIVSWVFRSSLLYFYPKRENGTCNRLLQLYTSLIRLGDSRIFPGRRDNRNGSTSIIAVEPIGYSLKEITEIHRINYIHNVSSKVLMPILI